MNNYGSQSLMIGFNDIINGKIIQFAKEYIPVECEKDPSKHQGIVDDPHISLLTDIRDAMLPNKVMDIVKKIPSFKVNFGTISFFKNDDTDIIKIDIESDQLDEVHYNLKSLLPNDYKFDEYHPHCTLAFVKPNSCDSILQYSNYFRGMSFNVEWLTFNSAMGIAHSIKINQK